MIGIHTRGGPAEDARATQVEFPDDFRFGLFQTESRLLTAESSHFGNSGKFSRRFRFCRPMIVVWNITIVRNR